MNHDVARTWIDEALVGELDAEHFGALHDHLRSCDECRTHYDRGMLAMRALEHAEDLSALELDMVERWLFEGPDPVDATAGARAAAWWRRPWVGLGAVLAGATALTLWLVPADPDGGGREREMQARGGFDASGIALQVLCGDALRPAEERGCTLDETMSFAYRVPSTAGWGRLVLFGVDGNGDTLYYAPTPIDPSTVEVVRGEWTPLPLSIDLEVNHEAGPLTVFALVTTNAVDVDDVDAFAAALSGRPPAQVGDDPWPRRVSSELFEGICKPSVTGDPGACRAAELSFFLHEAER